MKDRIMIVGVIVAIHVIVISLFVLPGNDDAAEDPVDVPSQETALEIPASAIDNSEDIDLDSNVRANLLSELNNGAANAQVHIVAPGETLMVISKRYYKTSRYYNYIYEHNKSVLKSPSSVRVGDKLIIPPTP